MAARRKSCRVGAAQVRRLNRADPLSSALTQAQALHLLVSHTCSDFLAQETKKEKDRGDPDNRRPQREV
jgi:hypothetical protein